MAHGPSQAVYGLGRPATNVPVNQPGVLDETEDNDLAAVFASTDNASVVGANALAADSVGASELSVAAGTEVLTRVKVWASSDINVAHGNPVTVTGIAVGDRIISILKDTTPNWVPVDASDATISADALTFTVTDFGANDGVIVIYEDLT